MRPEDIDNLFRNNLDDHATPPGDALWQRLQPAAGAERLDSLFQTNLNSHSTPPARELWERLEDEHLRPRKRRAAAWWPLALVATVALLLVAGGAGLWLRSGALFRTSAPVAKTTPARKSPLAAPAAPATGLAAADIARPVDRQQPLKKNSQPQATGSALASSEEATGRAAIGLASAAGVGAAPRRTQFTRPAAPAGLLAQHTKQQPGPATVSHPKAAPATAVAAATLPTARPDVVPAPQPVPATPTNAPDLAGPAGVIEVEVRRGGRVPAATPAATAVAQVEAPRVRRGLRLGQLGGLVARANNVVRDAKEGLAAVHNLPDNVTVQARVGGHTISKTIEL